MDYDMIGAIKIKDGLFIGDEFAAQVPNFLKLIHNEPRCRTWNS
jgi:hypothetical protein